MADWTTPKFDWVPNDVIGEDDFNRIEENTQYLYDRDLSTGDHLRNYIDGFEVYANSNGESVYGVGIVGGRWSDAAGNFVDWGTESMSKILGAAPWTAGAGNHCNVSGPTFGTNKWYWVYALYNPSTNAHDFAIDDNALGTNLGPTDPPAVAGYTLFRKICPVLTSTSLAVQGIIPMTYLSKEKKITYAGLDTSRITSAAGLGAGVEAGLNLALPGGQLMVPTDTVNNISEGGIFVFEVTVASIAGITIWQQDNFGIVHYAGVGPRKFYASLADVFEFTVEVPTSTIYIHSSAGNTVHVMMMSMTYSPDV